MMLMFSYILLLLYHTASMNCKPLTNTSNVADKNATNIHTAIQPSTTSNKLTEITNTLDIYTTNSQILYNATSIETTTSLISHVISSTKPTERGKIQTERTTKESKKETDKETPITLTTSSPLSPMSTTKAVSAASKIIKTTEGVTSTSSLTKVPSISIIANITRAETSLPTTFVKGSTSTDRPKTTILSSPRLKGTLIKFQKSTTSTLTTSSVLKESTVLRTTTQSTKKTSTQPSSLAKNTSTSTPSSKKISMTTSSSVKTTLAQSSTTPSTKSSVNKTSSVPTSPTTLFKKTQTPTIWKTSTSAASRTVPLMEETTSTKPSQTSLAPPSQLTSTTPEAIMTSTSKSCSTRLKSTTPKEYSKSVGSVKTSTASSITRLPTSSLGPYSPYSPTTTTNILKKTTTTLSTTKVEPSYTCPSVWVRNEHKGDYLFPKTDIFDEVRHHCQYGSSKKNWKVKRHCLFNKELQRGYWEKIDLTFCLTPTKEKGIIVEIEKKHVATHNAEEVLNFITTTVEDNKNLIQTKLDLSIIMNKTREIYHALQKPFRVEILSRFLGGIGNLIQVNKDIVNRNTYQQIDGIMKMILSRFHSSIRSSVDVNGKNIAISLKKVKYTSVKFSTINYNFRNISIVNEDLEPTSYIKLPKEIFNTLSSILLYEMVATNLMPTLRNQTIVSNILSAIIFTATKKSLENLEQHVEIKFQIQNLREDLNLSCRFWNETTGYWSTKGCRMHSWNKQTGTVLCKCDHLTSFAVIGEKIKSKEAVEEKENFTLHLIAFVGSFIAVFSLGITLITYICVRNIRKHINSKAIASFCASLILTIIAFVSTITFVTQPTSCFIASRFLHYFVLTSFCWMLVQAVNLYRAIVVISARRSDSFYFQWMSLFAWGVPLVIITITAFFSYQKQFVANSTGNICFVKDPPFYCSVLLPTILLLISNFFIFIPIFKTTSSPDDLLAADSIGNKRNKNMKQAKRTLAVTSMLALVWMMAILAAALKIMVLQYFFYFLIPFLGIVVLVFFVVKNEEAKLGWKEMWSCSKKEEARDYPELVKLRSKKNLLESNEKKEKRISIVINGDLYGYGTETFGQVPDPEVKDESENNTAPIRKKTESTTV